MRRLTPRQRKMRAPAAGSALASGPAVMPSPPRTHVRTPLVLERRGVSARGRVLIVDDDPAALHALASLLEGDGFTVDVATGGEEALRALAEQSPDVLLSDLHMPGMNGVELVRRARMSWPDLIAILVSAESRRPPEVLAAGVNGYLTKPVEVDELVALLDGALQVERERRTATV